MDKYLKNLNGEVSLMAAIAASLISAITIAAIFQGLSSSNGSLRLIAAKVDAATLKAQVQALIMDPNLCKNILKDETGKLAKYNPTIPIPADNALATTIKNYQTQNNLFQVAINEGFVLAKTGNPVGNLDIISTQLKEIEPKLRSGDPQTKTNQYFSELTISTQMSVRRGSEAGLPLALRFPLYVRVDQNWIITDCGTNLPAVVPTKPQPSPSTPVTVTSPSRINYTGANGYTTAYTTGASVVTGYGASGTFGQWSVFVSNTSSKITQSVSALYGNNCPTDHVVVGFAPNARSGLYCAPLQAGVHLVQGSQITYKWDFNSTATCPANQLAVGNVPNADATYFTLVCASAVRSAGN